MSRCWALALRCGKFCCTTNCRIIVSLSVGDVVQHVRSRGVSVYCGDWHLLLYVSLPGRLVLSPSLTDVTAVTVQLRSTPEISKRRVFTVHAMTCHGGGEWSRPPCFHAPAAARSSTLIRRRRLLWFLADECYVITIVRGRPKERPNAMNTSPAAFTATFCQVRPRQVYPCSVAVRNWMNLTTP